MRPFSPPPVTSPERSYPPLPGGVDLPGIPPELLAALAAAAVPDRVALVGGAVPDLLLHRLHADPWRGLPDLDLVVEAASLAGQGAWPDPSAALRLAHRLAGWSLVPSAHASGGGGPGGAGGARAWCLWHLGVCAGCRWPAAASGSGHGPRGNLWPARRESQGSLRFPRRLPSLPRLQHQRHGPEPGQ